MSVAAARRADLTTIAEEVVRGLASADISQGRAYIRTPLLLASGSTVVVAIEEDVRPGYIVSDLGQAADEADSLAVRRGFRQHAAQIAQLAGVDLKDGAFVISSVGREQLVSAVAVIADCVSRSVERATVLATEPSSAEAIGSLHGRLERVFRPSKVRKSAEICGASTHAWQVDALVETRSGLAAFELVRAHLSSVAAATTKFHDLARLDRAPARVAVVERQAALGDMLAIVSQAARVIEEAASDEVYRKVALAA